MERVVVTGAAGFLGRALGARLRAAGVEVVGIDRAADPASGIVAGDISEPGGWTRAFEGCDAVVHTAAMVGMPTDTSTFWAVNVRGVRLVLEAAARAGLRRAVHVSSVVTFGLSFPDGVDEWHPVRMTGVPYTDTKICAEQVALMAHAARELEVVIVRPGDIYGPRSRPWVELPLGLMRARRFVLPAGGRGIHSPVWVDDVVDGIVGALEVPQAAGRVVTLSGGVGVETRDYFRRLADAAGLSRRLAVPCVPTSAALAGAWIVDRAARWRGVPNELTPDAVRYLALRRGTYGISAARELLGWEPRVGLDEGFGRLADALTR